MIEVDPIAQRQTAEAGLLLQAPLPAPPQDTEKVTKAPTGPNEVTTAKRIEPEPLFPEEPLSARDPLSEATPRSVVEAQTQVAPPDTLPSPEEQAESRRINEAFQADLNMTALLAIIRGADLATVSAILNDVGPAAPAVAMGETPV